MIRGVRCFGGLRLLPNARVCLLDHLLAEINPDEIVLEDIVVKHVFGRLAKINDPLGNGWWPDPERHVLGVRCTGRMVVAANATDATGDKMCVTRILALHENAVATEDR
jgi:hypothetical protein